MPATAEKLAGSRVRLSVEVPSDDLQKEYGRAVQRVGRRLKIPGFRPGKAPRRLVERAAGEGALMQDMLEAVVPRAYTSALETTGVDPIDQPEIDLPDAPSLDAPLVFSAEVAVRPTVELGDVSGVTVEAPAAEVGEDDVDAQIEQIRATQASWEPVDRPAAAGDMIQTLIRMTAGGGAPDAPQPYNVLVGENGFPAGFDAAVTGRSAGDSASYDAVLPPDDPNEALRGQMVTIEIQIDAVNEQRLPDLDDEFARSVGPFDSVAALRERVTRELHHQQAHAAQREVEDRAVNALVERTAFEVADVLIDRERDQVIRERTQSLVDGGVAVDTYLAMQGLSRGDWEANARDDALRRIQRGLALDAYATQHELTVGEEEMQAEVDRVAGFYPEERRSLIRSNLMRGEARERVATTLRSRKALQALTAALTGGAGTLHDHEHDHEHEHGAPPPELAAAAEEAAAAHPAEPADDAADDAARPQA